MELFATRSTVPSSSSSMIKSAPIGQPIMRFHGRPSWVRYLAHIVALVCDDVLMDLNAGTGREAKKLLDELEVILRALQYLSMRHEVLLPKCVSLTSGY